MRKLPIFIFVALTFFGFRVETIAQTVTPGRVSIRVVTDEAEAVLAILEKKQRNRRIEKADWTRLFSSEGYIRLKKRSLSFKRPFEESDFRKFVLSEELAKRRKSLAETLEVWKRADIEKTGGLALAYLPESAQIRAKIYPVIKPRKNSFVFEIKSDPGIFLYLDPGISSKEFENILAHELHHIGFGTICPTPETAKQVKKLPKHLQSVLKWTGAFGEGFAMLAAAGGPENHPHAFSPVGDRRRWDRDVKNFNSDLKNVESFFLRLSNGKLNREKELELARSFYGIQGPWYTVGWKMAVVIEKTFGRKMLIECMCDNRKLFATFNDAVKPYNSKRKEKLIPWSTSLIGYGVGK
jgi:hypothetical protein